jgi:hypothetical protein
MGAEAMYSQQPPIAGNRLHPQPEAVPSSGDNVPPNTGYFLFLILKCLPPSHLKRNYSCKRPWRPCVCEILRIQHFLDIQLEDVGEVISHIHCPLFTAQTFLVLFSVRG